MKINLSNPATGCQKLIEVDDEKLRGFYDKRMSTEVEGENLSDEFKGYVFRISGGNDKQGFPMKQGVLTPNRVRLLLSAGHSCFRVRREGERRRKSVRGCIVSADLSVLNLVVVRKGAQEIAGLTDKVQARRRGPKRFTRIRKLFNLNKNALVSEVKGLIRRKVEKKGGKKPIFKQPKIQRLVTPQRLQHRRQWAKEKRLRFENGRKAATTYNALISQRTKEQQSKRAAEVAKRRSASMRKSAESGGAAAPKAVAGSTQVPAAAAKKP